MSGKSQSCSRLTCAESCNDKSGSRNKRRCWPSNQQCITQMSSLMASHISVGGIFWHVCIVLSMRMSPLPVLFCLSVSGRCGLDGSSIHQPIFCRSSHSPDPCPPIQPSTSFSQDLFGLPRFRWPFTSFASSVEIKIV